IKQKCRVGSPTYYLAKGKVTIFLTPDPIPDFMVLHARKQAQLGKGSSDLNSWEPVADRLTASTNVCRLRLEL
ncbi:hypothetical protein SFRURICE_019030, partial [Spodoptera frugiperda]